jgi:hypothetical protein
LRKPIWRPAETSVLRSYNADLRAQFMHLPPQHQGVVHYRVAGVESR